MDSDNPNSNLLTGRS